MLEKLKFKDYEIIKDGTWCEVTKDETYIFDGSIDENITLKDIYKVITTNVVFLLNDKVILKYDKLNEAYDERKNTIEQLAYENNCKIDDIKVNIENDAISIEVADYFKKNNINNLMEYGSDKDEGLHHLSSMYKEILDKLDIKIKDIYTEDGMSDGKYETIITFDNDEKIKIDTSAYNESDMVIDNIDSIKQEYDKLKKENSLEISHLINSIIDKGLEETIEGNYMTNLSDKEKEIIKNNIDIIKEYIDKRKEIADVEINKDGNLDINYYLDYCHNCDIQEIDEIL